MSNEEILKTIDKVGEELRRISTELLTKASACQTVGMNRLGNELVYFSERLVDGKEKLRRASGAFASNVMTAASEASENMLRAALAGATLTARISSQQENQSAPPREDKP